LPRKREIEAAIAACNAADPETLPAAAAARLLNAMFPCGEVCQRTVADLMVEVSARRRGVERLLRLLSEAGFLSKERRVGRAPLVYRLHLPPLVRR
jgi:hypothetical protein